MCLESKLSYILLFILDKFTSKSAKLTRWEIEEQSAGITDTMRVNLLNMISTSIDTHGAAGMQNIAQDIASWLDETYGRNWIVQIVETRNYQPSPFRARPQYLRLQETRLKWTITVFK